MTREAVEHIRDVTEHKRAEEERFTPRAERDEDDVMRVPAPDRRRRSRLQPPVDRHQGVRSVSSRRDAGR